MLDDGSQTVLGASNPGSLLSSNPNTAFQSSKLQPFCGDPEGWGPISEFRFDLTPCFLDAGVSFVAAWGLVMGAGALWYLLKKRIPSPVSKNWHFYTKLAAIQIESYPKLWFGDFQFWSSVLTLASLCVIFAVQYYEHWRSRQPNGVVLFYWVFFLIAYGVKLRSLIARHAWEDRLPYFVCFNVSLGLALLEFVLEYLVPKKQSDYDALGDEDECPYEYADIFSVLTFSWMTPLMKFGYSNYLTQDDLWNLRRRDATAVTGSTLKGHWDNELRKEKPSLSWALIKSFGGSFLRGGIIKCGSDALAFVQPQLLRLLISFINTYRTDEPEPIIRGVAIALAMFLVSISQTMCLHQYFQRAFDTGMRVKSALTAMIYAKSLKLSSEGRAAKTTGDIVNHMAVDQQRLSDLTQFGIQLWSAPFQITLCMLSLYQLVGYSMFAGIGVMILMIPLNGVIARMMKKLQLIQMKNKDSRSRLMTEILNNIKSIKLYAWNTAFMNKLSHIRNDLELNTLRKIGATQSVANFTWQSTPFLVSCSTFTVYALTQDKPLTTEVVFPALTLFNLLTFPLSILPMVITAVIEASVAIKRLTDYFTAEELQTDAVKTEEAVTHVGDESVRIRDASFTWNRYDGTHVIEDIDFSARKGELSCILGRVGAGKSSLLQALLGDLWRTQGEVIVRGRIAYVAQAPWVMNASVRENIVFGHRWDPQFYDLTVEACALLDDFKNLPDGDQTEVGERGISLSGGQKARLTLARAVYARADIYLLDDVLSAVDQHVGRHLINRVLGPNGILGSKTRILATNAIPVLKEADFIGLLRNKTIIEKGTYEQLLAMKGEVANLIRTNLNDSDDDDSGSESRDLASPESSESATVIENPDSDASDPEDAENEIGALAPIRAAAERRKSTGPRRKLGDEENQGKNSNIIATAQVAGSFWLKHWSEVSEVQPNVGTGKYIGVYLAFGLGSSLLVILQNLILWIFCSIEASRKLHERMAFAIFRSPMSFFETTPSGRILNRFSSDVYRIDEVLARTFNMLFGNSAKALFTMIVIASSTPAFLLLVIPLSYVYFSYQKYYLRTSRELKRLDSVTRSPIFAHFQESLGGISTIRAYSQEDRFVMENEWRMDANIRAYFPSISANRWLAVRLEFIGSMIILASAVLSIASVATGSGLSAGMVGLAMSYALQITQSLNWIVRQTVEVETNIVSVERVLEYANLPSEAPEVIFKHRPAIGWPAQGAVSFENYSTRYRAGLDLVLKDINLDIKPHEKIGVVGRTGAGKSSLTLALFRIIEPDGGNISIDGLNVSSIGLFDLRGRLAIIPQDPAMFEGTVRDNLDPRHVHDDTELWSVLEHARLKDHIAQMDGQLDAQIMEGGSNLSQGQRQLVSLARALLTPSNILVLDEATAAVDVETDALLQRTLRSSIFQDRTIITIAHRINTIIDSDRIVVLDKGRVVEFDTPAELIKSQGKFYELVKESGLLDSSEGPGLTQPS
ncbi:P-loop containing nucleoside triphosphate hydrolase protein [Aspergillus ellipticus CBS 707.79]|uniref:P-loop containing nucleoside triphosphate hydrolase protein n=1 Tax=Aspergillus ellipticus CBS 707.79 TaxID=1448320 RepID=A0A319DFX6_9EURO|nr:P-loop containing nucleoside triphosphate hydrolase protein [Aspergillus ellipticus CBS 707.79]